MTLAAPHIHIILATYKPNPVHFRQQIQSILSQDHQHFTLYIVPDGTDGETSKCVEDIDDRRVHFLAQETRLGVTGNFMRGLAIACSESASEQDRFAFSDQDDVWNLDKLSRLISRMSATSSEMCYSDATVIDKTGTQISSSVFRSEGRSPHRSLLDLVIANDVTGMTMLFTRRVARLVLRRPPPLREPVMMHDWWTALVAILAGNTCFEPEPLVAYRFHEKNIIGPRLNHTSMAKRGFMTKAYIAMCKLEYAKYRTIFVALKQLCSAEKISFPAMDINALSLTGHYFRYVLSGQSIRARHMFRALTGRLALLAELRQSEEASIDQLCLKLIDNATQRSLDEITG